MEDRIKATFDEATFGDLRWKRASDAFKERLLCYAAVDGSCSRDAHLMLVMWK